MLCNIVHHKMFEKELKVWSIGQTSLIIFVLQTETNPKFMVVTWVINVRITDSSLVMDND